MPATMVTVAYTCERCGFIAEGYAELLPGGTLAPIMPNPRHQRNERQWRVLCDPPGPPTPEDNRERRWRAWCDRVLCHEDFQKVADTFSRIGT